MRLEAETGTRIVGDYGHGGAGVTLSWGCAEDIADIADIAAAHQNTADQATSQV